MISPKMRTLGYLASITGAQSCSAAEAWEPVVLFAELRLGRLAVVACIQYYRSSDLLLTQRCRLNPMLMKRTLPTP